METTLCNTFLGLVFAVTYLKYEISEASLFKPSVESGCVESFNQTAEFSRPNSNHALLEV